MVVEIGLGKFSKFEMVSVSAASWVTLGLVLGSVFNRSAFSLFPLTAPYPV